MFVVVLLWATLAGAQLVAEQAAFFENACNNTNIRLFLLPSRWCQAGVSPCDWTGVTCDAATRSTVERLAIDFDNITPLNGELGSLADTFSSLIEFRLGCGNGLVEGTIPPAFFQANADTLRTFVVHDCPLVRGSLPLTTGLPLAANVTVRATSFSGRLTDGFLADSPLLVQLTLSMSSFNGTLPDDGFAETNSLRVLDLSHNRFHGLVPPTICQLPRLERLDLSHNYLDLALPACFLDSSNFISPDTECDLSDNYYCDTYPDPALYAPCVVNTCDELPSPDECGVCGGDASTCVGCDGVPNSGAVDDVCGECNGSVEDVSLCPDCFGVPGGSAVRDLCGVCGGNNSTCIDCAGELGGSACYDACDVCNGDNSACTDCRGLLFGTSVRDVCGVCDGDGTTCDDCNGEAGGGAEYDRCGVCGGNGLSCLDCQGVVNGTSRYDECDVCNGDGSDCGLGLIEDGLDDRGIAATYLWTVIWLLAAAIVMCLCPVLIYLAFFTPSSRRERRARR